MFLDPEPKRNKRGSSSGFFSSQRPIESPRDRTTTRFKALPLQERTPSQNNQQTPWQSPDKPTVRLVKASPNSTDGHKSDADKDGEDKKEIRQKEEDEEGRFAASALVKQARTSDAEFPGFLASSQDKSVSDSNTSTNKDHASIHLGSDALLSTTPTHVAFPKTEWHRRSASTGNCSTASTLKEAESVYGQKDGRRESRFSQGTTLRGTPTPSEQEHRQRIEAEEDAVRQLQTLQEASPDRSTIPVVPPTQESESSEDLPQPEQLTSVIVRPRTSTSSDSKVITVSRKSSRRTSSTSSLPAPLSIREASSASSSRPQTGQQSIAQSEATLPALSSPNFVAYASSPPRSRSGSYPLHYSYSIESIQSRLQYPVLVRPGTGRSRAASDSSASFRPSSSTDTLPPLRIPKKRLRHKQALSSLGATAHSTSTGHSMAYEEVDTLPYPRDHFSRVLSTIASESDRTTSQHLSHFSLGSGVLTGDDSSSIPLSAYGRGRRESAPIDSSAWSEPSPVAPATSSGEEPGDMTMGVFREESAKPQPLFKPRSGSAPGHDRTYDGPLPPIPPIPKSRDSDENWDTVSELQSPPLREQRSGYSLRRRSNSTPSRSHSRQVSQISRNESDRWSGASSLFPVWAKQFYGQGAQLMSASKVSMSTPHPSKRVNGNGNGHGRNDSQWTERSITSRLGTGYSEIEESDTASSHFLPSIFRPRTRGRSNTEGNKRSPKLRKSKPSRPSGDVVRSDSMTIFTEPFPLAQSGEQLPSGQPKYGALRDTSEHRPLPRKYSKQRKWDEMEFPRPMTKDRLSDFGMRSYPHLAPNKRVTSRYSAWRPPSFVESLDTLVRSKGNRQILLFALGFVCPLLWMLAAVLPISKNPAGVDGYEASVGGSEDDIQAAMMKHEAGDAEKRWREEKVWLKARWWRTLNRIMSLIGMLVIGAVIALAIVATTH
ncbi:hypothetical protein LTR37_016982 [Vermiconidia calcicola]|uniref:Uncharacterized protein n=1 Tax=Vermiconidia calcicola TaxID=1690605 RepID=A0ACC3ML97_9PEZI|nr:hypothetical protein LTR37_016982 [Vermiconidia calcicola]